LNYVPTDWSTSLYDYHCPGSACSGLNLGAVVGGGAACLVPAAANLNNLSILYIVSEGVYSNDGGLAQAMSALNSARLAARLGEKTDEVKAVATFGKGATFGLSLPGGVVSAYGEWNASDHDAGRTILVGVADIGVNYGGAVVGGIAADALLGGEIGEWLGPWGAIAGAALGDLVGSAIGYFDSNTFNSLINSLANFFKA
jgi:hypothetical protein